MRSIKVFIICVISLLCFLWIITLFLPSKVTVSKSILIHATEAMVAKEIGTFKNWKNWYPSFQNQNITTIISQKKDSSFATLLDNRQKKLSMIMIRHGLQNIEVLLFEENKNNVTYQFILSTNRTGQTQLTWNVNTTLSWYPWKKITGIFLDKVTGPQYQEALQNLKTAAEAHHEGSSG